VIPERAMRDEMRMIGDDRYVTTPDDGWVLAVDVRTAPPLLATAERGGVRTQSPDAAGGDALGLAGAAHAGSCPLAVVVVHPATWDGVRVGAALDQIAGRAPAPGWPSPVPLTVPEAVAWRALQFGLIPARGRLAVLDPVEREAVVVDRDGDSLTAVGVPMRLEREPDEAEAPADLGVRLVALARQALDAAPAGPPFAGVLLAGALPGADPDAAELPGLVAQITGRAPLLPGDPARAAVLGAAALGWSAATAEVDEPPPGPGQTPSGPVAPAGRAAPGLAAPPGRAAAPLRTRRPRLWLTAVAGLLLVAAVVVGLTWRRARTAPAPFTYTCSDGQVVAYSYECATLAPSAGP